MSNIYSKFRDTHLVQGLSTYQLNHLKVSFLGCFLLISYFIQLILQIVVELVNLKH